MDRIFLYLWLVVMTVTLLAAPLNRKIQDREPLTQESFVSAAFALGGAIALMKVLIKVLFTQPQIQEDLEWDSNSHYEVS